MKALTAEAKKPLNPYSVAQGEGKKRIFIGEIGAAWETRLEKSGKIG